MPDPPNYRTLSVPRALAVLEAKDFDQFKGVLEDGALDFKREPYPLSGATAAVHEKAKRDLVEDVVRFANVEGGIIILGVETEKIEEQRTEVGTTIRPFPRDRVDPGQHYDVIAERVRPRPRDVVVKWYPGREGRDGLAAVIVPPQPPDARGTFFATRTMVDEATGRTVGAYIGYFERRGSEGFAMSADELYQTFQLGRRFRELQEQLGEQSELLRRLLEQQTPPAKGAAEPAASRLPGPDLIEASNRRGVAIAAAGLNERPSVSLIAIPGEAVEVPELFAGSRSALVQLLEQPPELRDAGFDLTVGERPTVFSGGRRVLNPGSRILELHRDGVLIFAAEASGQLCWGTATEEEPLRLNVLALAETTYLFAELVRQLSPHLRPPPDSWRYVFGLHAMEVEGKRPVLAPGPRRAASQAFPSRRRVLPEHYFEFRSLAIPVNRDPRIVAYQLRRELYIRFGFDEEAIPYVIDVSGERGTDPERIRQDGKGP